MFHNQNHNPFEDLMKISSANAGAYQTMEEEVNPYFALGMNEEFAKIAEELGEMPADDVRTPLEKKRQAAAARTRAQNATKAKGVHKGKPNTAVKRAQDKAMKEEKFKAGKSNFKGFKGSGRRSQW